MTAFTRLWSSWMWMWMQSVQLMTLCLLVLRLQLIIRAMEVQVHRMTVSYKVTVVIAAAACMVAAVVPGCGGTSSCGRFNIVVFGDNTSSCQICLYVRLFFGNFVIHLLIFWCFHRQIIFMTALPNKKRFSAPLYSSLTGCPNLQMVYSHCFWPGCAMVILSGCQFARQGVGATSWQLHNALILLCAQPLWL